MPPIAPNTLRAIRYRAFLRRWAFRPQLDDFQPGLMAAVLGRDEQGRLVRKTGVMGIVLAEGVVRPGDPIRVELPPEPRRELVPV